MKKAFILLLFSVVTTSSFAQYDAATQRNINEGIERAATASQTAESIPPAWTHIGIVGLNMSQASFSNWVAGGDPSVAFDFMFNFDLNYRKGRNLWTNRLELAYGISRTESTGTRKTNDKIYLGSSYGYAIAKNLYLGAMLTFNTQFDKGFDYVATPDPDRDTDYISKFMSPGYLTIGLGIIWTPQPWFKLTYAPLSWRGTFVFDDSLPEGSRYGVPVGRNLLNQVGSNLVLEVNKRMWERFNFYSRLDLFSNYLSKPQNIITRWDTTLSMNVTRWLSANFNFSLIYDDNAIQRLQLREIFGIGVQATF